MGCSVPSGASAATASAILATLLGQTCPRSSLSGTFHAPSQQTTSRLTMLPSPSASTPCRPPPPRPNKRSAVHQDRPRRGRRQRPGGLGRTPAAYRRSVGATSPEVRRRVRSRRAGRRTRGGRGLALVQGHLAH